MVMKDEFVNIVLTINNKYAVPTYITIQSLFQYAAIGRRYRVIIISEDLTRGNRKELELLQKETRHELKFIYLSELNVITPKVSYYWPKVVYYRLVLCDILKEYDKVIFSDVDILVQGDLYDVWKIEMGSSEIAAVAAEDNRKGSFHQYYEENDRERIYWDGFMVMNLKEMRKNNWVSRCNVSLKKYQNRLRMADLEIINMIANNIIPLDIRYVYLQSLYDATDITETYEWQFLRRIYTKEYLEREKEKVIIIHYAGIMGNPWIRKNIPDYYKPYMRALPFRLKAQNYLYRMNDRIRHIGGVLFRKFKRMRSFN